VGTDPERFTLIAPFTKDSSRWLKQQWVNIYDGQTYRLAPAGRRLPYEAVAKTYGDVVKEYMWHPEAKSLGPDGEPGGKQTRGLLRRTLVQASGFRFFGKETDRRWEQGEDFSLLQQNLLEYRAGETERLSVDPDLQQILCTGSIRRIAKEAGVSLGTVKSARRGDRIRKSSARKLWRAVKQSNFPMR
jgi:hypothetical protein